MQGINLLRISSLGSQQLQSWPSQRCSADPGQRTLTHGGRKGRRTGPLGAGTYIWQLETLTAEGDAVAVNKANAAQEVVHAAAVSAPQHIAQPQAAVLGVEITLEVVESIAKVSAHEWDALVNGGAEFNPFLLHAFLLALEESGSAVPSQGWLPQHVLARDAASGALLGGVPLYLKGHSYGEYVFDSAWANLAEMLGVRYYPKLQGCVPFTPVTGPRLLVSPALDRTARQDVLRALGRGLIKAADTVGVSSLHLTFTTAEEWAVLGQLGFKQRLGIQFHWDNRQYGSFEDFLGTLKQAKRKSIRQERKSVSKQGLVVRVLSGRQLSSAHWDRFHRFYLSTVDRKWGTAYLTRDFFHRLGRAMPDQVLLIVAEEAAEQQQGGGADVADGAASSSAAAAAQPADASRMVAAALNLVGSHALYGRNWGCVEDREWKNLHFEVCYYAALEEAIARGLPRVEAGAQGEHKLQRGYLPSFTHSLHYIRDERLSYAVERFLDRERGQIERALQVMSLESSPYKLERTVQSMLQKITAYRSLSSSSSSDTDDGSGYGSSSTADGNGNSSTSTGAGAPSNAASGTSSGSSVGVATSAALGTSTAS